MIFQFGLHNFLETSKYNTELYINQLVLSEQNVSPKFLFNLIFKELCYIHVISKSTLYRYNDIYILKFF